MYMNICSPGYMQVLYDQMAGHMIMGILLGLYAAAVYIGSRILDIKV